MKKFILFFTACAAVFAAASCNKATVVPDQENNTEVSEFVKISFNAEIEKTKTTLQIDGTEGKVSWEEGDEVKILWDGGSAVGTIVDNVLEVEAAVAADYYAVYPADASAAIVDGKLEVVLPSTVDGSFASANYMAAKSDDNSMLFKHICGIARIEISKPEEPTLYYTKLEIRAVEPTDKSIAGTETVDFSEGIAVTTKTASGDNLITTVNINADVQANGGFVYVPVRVDAVWNHGFACRLTRSDNNIKGTLSTGKLAWGRAQLFSLGDVNVRAHNWYITENGTGDGTSWDNAAGPVQLRNLLSKNIWRKVNGEYIVDGTFDGVVNEWRLHNRKIYIAAGNYNIVDANDSPVTLAFTEQTNLTIQGGFPTNASGKDITGYDPEANVTNLYAEYVSSAANKRVFNGQGNFRTLIFKGLHFTSLQSHNCASARGAVAYFNADAQTATGKNYRGVIFEDCIFENNQTSGLGLVDANFMAEVNKGKIEFVNCTFKSNQTSGTGGAVFVSEGATTSAKFTGCKFESNSAKLGGAVLMNKGTASFTDCTFSANEATSTGGSAVALNAGTCEFTGCVFEHNATKGASPSNKYSHYKSGAVGVFNTNGATSVRMEQCSFVENTSEAWAADMYIYSTTANAIDVYVDRTSFYHASAVGRTDGTTAKSGLSIASSVKNDASNAKPVLALNNCTIAEPTSTNASGCALSWFSTNLCLVNTTIYGGYEIALRNDYSIITITSEYYAMNNTVYALKEVSGNRSIDLSNATGGNWADSSTTPGTLEDAKYNLVGVCQNRYSKNASYNAETQTWSSSGDTKPYPYYDAYVNKGDISFEYNNEGRYCTFVIAEGKETDKDRPVRYTTTSVVENFVQAKCPGFDTWLKTVNNAPYSIDIAGNTRNANKIQHGSWDAGL